MGIMGNPNKSPYWNPLGDNDGDRGKDGNEPDESGQNESRQDESGAEDARDRRRERAAGVLARRIRRRASMRDLARALLIGALVTLAVLAVEIGRKAFVVIHRADRPFHTTVG